MIRISLLHPDLLSKLLTPEEFAARLPPAWRERFVAKVNFDGPDGPLGKCWVWTANINERGYGTFTCRDRSQYAYRLAWEQCTGQRNTDKPLSHHSTVGRRGHWVLHHRCENPACVRPRHIQQTSNKANCLMGRSFAAINARKTHCNKGHPLIGDNLYPGRYRRCKTCTRDRNNACGRRNWHRRRTANPEHFRIKSNLAGKKWRLLNPERVKQHSKASRERRRLKIHGATTSLNTASHCSDERSIVQQEATSSIADSATDSRSNGLSISSDSDRTQSP